MSDEILTLEHGFFTDGSPDFYRRAVADDAMLVVPGMGRLSKAQCVEAAAHAGPWAEHEIDQLHTVAVAEGVVALSYHVTARRAEQPPYEAWMTSVWRRGAGGWQLVAHQQTPVQRAVSSSTSASAP